MLQQEESGRQAHTLRNGLEKIKKQYRPSFRSIVQLTPFTINPKILNNTDHFLLIYIFFVYNVCDLTHTYTHTHRKRKREGEIDGQEWNISIKQVKCVMAELAPIGIAVQN